jgi:hypothetical protein
MRVFRGTTGNGVPLSVRQLLVTLAYPWLTKLSVYQCECPAHTVFVQAKVFLKHGLGFPAADSLDVRVRHPGAVSFTGECPP